MTGFRRTADDVLDGECGEPHPHDRGTYCSRPIGHKGGHIDRVKNEYWQAEESVTA